MVFQFNSTLFTFSPYNLPSSVLTKKQQENVTLLQRCWYVFKLPTCSLQSNCVLIKFQQLQLHVYIKPAFTLS